MDKHVANSLNSLLGVKAVITDLPGLNTYESDAGLNCGLPDGVIMPRTADDVAGIVKWAIEHNLPLVARGAGTGLSGGAVAEHGGLIVEFSRMNHLIELDEIGRSAVVEPGLVTQSFDETVKRKGLYYPPDPASSRASTLGGNLAENSGGPHCFKYGVTSNYVTGLHVILADGRQIDLGGRALDYPEYDFAGLLVGSEGTIGLITQANLRLVRNPPATRTMMVAFDSIGAAGTAVSAIIAHGLVPATIELMDQKIMCILEDFTHAGLPVEAGAALIIETDGYESSASLQMDEIVAILREFQPRDIHIAQTTGERDAIWHARKSTGGALTRLAPSYYPADCTVPRSQIAQVLNEITQVCNELDLRVGYLAHAGDGNLHPHILIDDPSDQSLLDRVYTAGRRVMEICVDHGGSITGEHGIGIEKRAFMSLMFTADELATMQEIKGIFDPGNLLNPGKIFPPRSLHLLTRLTAILFVPFILKVWMSSIPNRPRKPPTQYEQWRLANHQSALYASREAAPNRAACRREILSCRPPFYRASTNMHQMTCTSLWVPVRGWCNYKKSWQATNCGCRSFRRGPGQRSAAL